MGHDEDYYVIPTDVGILPTGLKMLTCVSGEAIPLGHDEDYYVIPTDVEILPAKRC